MWSRRTGAIVAALSLRTEAISRSSRMLRTALGPAIASWLEDPAVVEVMLNPDGRLWIDRLTEGLADTGERLFCGRRRAGRASRRPPRRSGGASGFAAGLRRTAGDRRAL